MRGITVPPLLLMRKTLFAAILLLTATLAATAQKSVVDYVNPFIGTTNFGTCNPGAVVPTGMMSVVPFNVMGSDLNAYDKDARWWSTPYEHTNSYFTGYAHTSLSGVGCPEMACLLLMPTTGELDVDYHHYGSTYTDEVASPGYYSNRLTKYDILTEVSATRRTAIHRYTFPAGQSHLLLNLGEGLTNESGATVRFTPDGEIEGTKLLGTFCYCSQAVFPLYFVMRVEKVPTARGLWKKQRPMTAEADWDADQGKYKRYEGYTRDLSGDDIGAYLTFDTKAGETVEVRIGISYVSIANARENLYAEQPQHKHFDDIRAEGRSAWEKALSTVEVEGGTQEQRTVFYTALYHLQLHPNTLQDVNGEYPAMGSGETRQQTTGNRYTVFSLWDTYRCTHQLMTLLFPDRQLDMVRTMVEQYRESGWLPKWELYGQETFTMEGDPAIPVIADTWLKGLRDFDITTAYEAMRKSAITPGKDNPLRPDNDDYLARGYCPMTSQYDNSVSHALEYYVADYALSRLADALGKKADAKLFRQRSLGYKHYYSKEYGTLRPILPDGTFYTPFDPKQGENFEPSPGFHEGNAWNYTFAVPHDVAGLARLMGGDKAFVARLQGVFDAGNYDPANEPDIIYPYLFSRFKGEEWRTQHLTRTLLAKHFRNAPDGLPGNEDTGTMSAWAAFSMMGFYPDCPAEPYYTLTAPVFSKVTIHLDPSYYKGGDLVIVCPDADRSERIASVTVGGKPLHGLRIAHEKLVSGEPIVINMQ